MTTITRVIDGATSTPHLVDGYETSVEGRSVVHDLIEGIAVTLIPPRPRAGALRLFFPEGDEASAWACLNMHRTASTFTITDLDRPGIGMTYVVAGRVTFGLDDETREDFMVTVEYQEIVP